MMVMGRVVVTTLVVIVSVLVTTTHTFTVSSELMRKASYKAGNGQAISGQSDHYKSLSKFLEMTDKKKNLNDKSEKKESEEKARLKVKSLEEEKRRLDKKFLKNPTEEKIFWNNPTKEKNAGLRKEKKAAKSFAEMKSKKISKNLDEMKYSSKEKRAAKLEERREKKEKSLAKERILKKRLDEKESMNVDKKKILLKQETARLEKKLTAHKEMKEQAELLVEKFKNKEGYLKKELAKPKWKNNHYLMKLVNDIHETQLKEAQPYMKEGRTLQERRELKALRRKREALEAWQKGRYVSSEQTKSFRGDSFKTKHLKALQKFSDGNSKLPGKEGLVKAAVAHSKFRRSPDFSKDLAEDESNGNAIDEELGEDSGIENLDKPEAEISTEEVESTPDEGTDSSGVATSAGESISLGTTVPDANVPLPNSEANTAESSAVLATAAAGAEPESPPSVVYAENESADVIGGETPILLVTLSPETHSASPEDSAEIISHPSGDSDESHSDFLSIVTLPPDESSEDDLNVLEIPEIVDNSISSEVAGEPAGGDEEVVPTTVTPNLPRGPWPWDLPTEGGEQCGQARFGPEARGSRRRRTLKILQGKEALPGAFPWQVAILDHDRDLLCGGSLIAPRWVMTAAHCVRKKLHVRLSEHHIRSKDGYEVEMKVRRIFRHPEYNSSSIDNDIALLRLPALPPIPEGESGRASPGITSRACLPANGTDFPPVGTRCMVMGWGKESVSHSFGSDILMYTRLPIISRKACQRANRKTITENMFCAGHYKGGSDTCSGDSGGPLLCAYGDKPGEETWTAYGVTSFGDGCGVAGKMGVYAKVNNYLDWMAGIMSRYL